MTFSQEAVRDKPIGLYVLDDTSPFLDRTGLASAASFVGSAEAHGISLIAGSLFSQKANNSNKLAFPTSVYMAGRETQDFSLEASIRLVRGTNSQPLQILSHNGDYDGLIIDGTVVSFSTSYTTEPDSVCSYDIQQDQEIHVVGVHTSSRNSLYINGVLVGEVTISDAQEKDSYASSDAALYTGASTGNDSLLINGVAFYPHALSGDSVKRHYMASVNMPSSHDVVGIFSGISTNPGLDAEGILFDRWWSTAEDWKLGAMTGTAVLNDRLQPQFEEDTSIPGDWSTSVDLLMNTTSISGISIFWSGKGATVEVSLDGITWVEASNGYRLPIIPPGFNPTDKDLFVRITFVGGIENDDSYIDNLNIVASRTESVTTLGGRSMGFSSASQRREYMVQSVHDNNGVVLGAGATVTLTPDFSESPDAFARTLELWLKAESTQPTISVSGTQYINGVANSGNFPTNEWCLVHIVSGSNITGAITITGPVQIGNIGIYNDPLTANDITNVYNQYFANSAVRVDDNSTFSMTQSGEGTRLYGGAWTNGAVN